MCTPTLVQVRLVAGKFCVVIKISIQWSFKSEISPPRGKLGKIDAKQAVLSCEISKSDLGKSALQPDQIVSQTGR